MQFSDNQYQIQGLDVLEICQKFDTPLYIYDSSKILDKIATLQKAFQGIRCKFKYAAKALTNLSILQIFKKKGVGLDVVSIQEAQMGILAGYAPHEILFTPNGVAIEEIQEAVKLGLVINIDNISILEQFGSLYGSQVPCCIRFNPHIMAGGNSKISVGHIDSKFGISVLQARHVLRVVKAYDIRINGLHMHTGSDILDAEVFLRGAEIIFDLAKDFQDLEFIDLGSGFKVAYKPGDVITDVEELGQKIGAAFRQFCHQYGKEVELWFEPGKFFVSEAGYFLVNVNVIKQTPATIFAGVNSGFNHLIRPMFYDSYHEIINVSNPQGPLRVYSVVGYICETDTFAADRKLNEVREGDILAFKNAGAYGFMMSSNYNSRFRPAEVLIENGEVRLIRRRETMEDLLRNQIFEKETVPIAESNA
ncbi:MAG TPA: diaminopimelate decarboxylase [Microscillaceae bacterium]|nr:diaminopimelate decarboxylase [Microscillaceae bacterium]